LGSKLRQKAGTLSGGEQQMLSLSRAFIRQAPLVVADELSFGLAPQVIDTIFSALDALRRAGSALLIVEQYTARLLEISDYVYVLDRGSVRVQGPPAELEEDQLWTSA
jgi:branched-chain amino acid transport system ATP-binding protein